MLAPLLLTLTSATIDLGPPRPVAGSIVYRLQHGVQAKPIKLKALLVRCARQVNQAFPTQQALEIRLVQAGWLTASFPTPKGLKRRGRYYPAQGAHPALIYAQVGPDVAQSIAHEWLHHLDQMKGRQRPERTIEQEGKRCASASSP
jgi:hypothetical protein